MYALIISLVILFLIFILNLIVGMYYGFGVRHHWFFQIEHVLGGFFVAMFLSSFTDSRVVILIGLAVVTFIWELLEYAVAYIPSWSEYIKTTLRLRNVEYSWADGIFDLVCNYAGAILFLYLLK